MPGTLYSSEDKETLMDAKPEILSTLLGAWILAAIVCAALPFMHAIAALEELASLAPFLAALIFGLALAIPLNLAARRLGGLDTRPRTKEVWALLSSRAAAWLGIFGWGLPVGLMFAQEEFVQQKSLAILIPNAVIWPLAGVAFGLAMRWVVQRRDSRHAA
jgi:hypothetical protein